MAEKKQKQIRMSEAVRQHFDTLLDDLASAGVQCSAGMLFEACFIVFRSVPEAARKEALRSTVTYGENPEETIDSVQSILDSFTDGFRKPVADISVDRLRDEGPLEAESPSGSKKKRKRKGA